MSETGTSSLSEQLESQTEQMEEDELLIGEHIDAESSGQMDHIVKELALIMRKSLNSKYQKQIDQLIKEKDKEYAEKLQNELNERKRSLEEFTKKKDLEYAEKLQDQVNDREKRLEEFIKKKDLEYSEMLQNEVNEKEKRLEEFIKKKDQEYSEKLQNELIVNDKKLEECIKEKDMEYAEKLKNKINENEKRLEDIVKKKDEEYSEKLQNEQIFNEKIFKIIDLEYSEKLQNEVNKNEKRLEEFNKMKDQEYSEKLHNELTVREKQLEEEKELEIKRIQTEMIENVRRLRKDIETEIANSTQSKIEQLEIDLEYHRNMHQESKKDMNELVIGIQDKISVVIDHQQLFVEADKKREAAEKVSSWKQVIKTKENEINNLLEKHRLEKVQLSNTIENYEKAALLHSDEKQKLRARVEDLMGHSGDTEIYRSKFFELQDVADRLKKEVEECRKSLDIQKEKHFKIKDHALVTYVKQNLQLHCVAKALQSSSSLQDGSMPQHNIPFLALAPPHQRPQVVTIPQRFSVDLSGSNQINNTSAIRENTASTSTIHSPTPLALTYLTSIRNSPLIGVEPNNKDENPHTGCESENFDHNYATNIKPDIVSNIIPYSPVSLIKVEVDVGTTTKHETIPNHDSISHAIPNNQCEEAITKVEPNLDTDIDPNNYNQVSATNMEQEFLTDEEQGLGYNCQPDLVTDTIVMPNNCGYVSGANLDKDSTTKDGHYKVFEHNLSTDDCQDIVTNIHVNSIADLNHNLQTPVTNREQISVHIVMPKNCSNGAFGNVQRNLETRKSARKRPRRLSPLVLKRRSTEYSSIPQSYMSLGRITPHINQTFNVCGSEKKKGGTTDQKRPYVCMDCNKSFFRADHLRRHERSQRHKGGSSYVPQHCNKMFPNSMHLEKHQRVLSEERSYVCLLCKKKFKLAKHLARHSKNESLCYFETDAPAAFGATKTSS